MTSPPPHPIGYRGHFWFVRDYKVPLSVKFGQKLRGRAPVFPPSDVAGPNSDFSAERLNAARLREGGPSPPSRREKSEEEEEEEEGKSRNASR